MILNKNQSATNGIKIEMIDNDIECVLSYLLVFRFFIMFFQHSASISSVIDKKKRNIGMLVHRVQLTIV